MNCFLVGRWAESDGDQWEVQGVYDNQEDANEVCLNHHWFVMPIEKNKALPLTSESVGYYPNTAKQHEE